MRSLVIVTAVLVGALPGICPATAGKVDSKSEKRAKSILRTADFTGGLVVHLGCGDGSLTAALRADDDSTIVHGLDTSHSEIRTARQHIRSTGCYGPVSVEHSTSAFLPYVDNTVNLLVVEDTGNVSKEEMTRVLVPGGVLLVNSKGKWTKTVKQPRKSVDEWTHFNYDASNNAISNDRVVAPPRHLQWTSEPAFGRGHEFMPSISAMVSSGGRIFYVEDGAPIGNQRVPACWHLVARDAYNGILLWKRKMPVWFPTYHWWGSIPTELNRRLVAVGHHVYATLGYHAPVSILNAATGDVLNTIPQTKGATEFIVQKDILVAVIAELTKERVDRFEQWKELSKLQESPLHDGKTATPIRKAFDVFERYTPRSLVAVDVRTGKVLWTKSGVESKGMEPDSEIPAKKSLSSGIATKGLGQSTLCAYGEKVIFQTTTGITCVGLKTGNEQWVERQATLRMVCKEGAVCCREKELLLLSLDGGQVVWSQPMKVLAPLDLFAAEGSLWVGGFKPYNQPGGPSSGPYFAVQRDLATGKAVNELSTGNLGHHHRCHTNKATLRYILAGRRGTEFMDLKSGDVLRHSWARGTCRYGIMPANGFLYAPPHSCGCYMSARLQGLAVLAGSSSYGVRGVPNERLEKVSTRESGGLDERGSDVGTVSPSHDSADWPTYRGNSGRSGLTTQEVCADLSPGWEVDLGAKLTPPTVANGRVFVACPDRHEVVAVSSESGEIAWRFTAGGPVDSPPTIHSGLVLFGCNDGYVYCLNASDGALVWRFQAARDTQRLVAYGRLESVFPVHGSVLVQDEAVYFMAGRLSYLDGGMDIYRLHPRSGKVLSKNTIHSVDPKNSQQAKPLQGNKIPGNRSDILSADDHCVYLQDKCLDKQTLEETRPRSHMFAMTGFLDDSWTHRSHWIFGTEPRVTIGSGGGGLRRVIYGRLLSYDQATVYGYARARVDWSNEFKDGPYHFFAQVRNLGEPQWKWRKRATIKARAMIVAGEIMFAGGQSANQDAVLHAISAVDGSDVSQHKLDADPVFNGMAAANGKLFISLVNGKVICMQGK